MEHYNNDKDNRQGPPPNNDKGMAYGDQDNRDGDDGNMTQTAARADNEEGTKVEGTGEGESPV
jgi:hypothetical protein